MNPFVIPDKDSSFQQPIPSEQRQGQRIIKNPAEHSKQQFQDLLTCHICFCHVNNPMMCPHCSKLFCQSCIRRCLLLKSECPYCRKQVKGSATMTGCNRFVNQLITIVNQLIDHKIQQQICQQHQVAINYYCQNCSQPICCQCQMFGSHQGHSLKKLSIVYQARYDVLREMLTQFKSKLRQKQMSLKQVQQELMQLRKLKDKHLKELDQYIEQYRVKIVQESTNQAAMMEQSVQNYSLLIQRLNGLEEQLVTMADQAEKNSKYCLDEVFVQRVQDITKQEIPKIQRNTKSVLQEVIPPYLQNHYTITQFSTKRRDKQIIFSPIQKIEGSEWRLKIYPNGNQNVQGIYLSIFIQMVSTIHESTVYEYQIQIINRKNPNHRMVREYQSTFEPGQSWGYNKYIKLQNLGRQGFVDPVTDELDIKYSIRNPFYYNIYKQKEHYLQHLDTELLKQEAEIQQLQRLLQKNTHQQ